MRITLVLDDDLLAAAERYTPEFDSSEPQNLYISNGINRLAALF